MTEFDTQPEVTAPVSTAAPPPVPQQQSFLTRPVFLGYSLPWLLAIVLGMSVVAWYLFWPSSSSQDASQRAFGQDAGLVAAQQPAAATVASVPLQTGGLSVPVTAGTNGAGISASADVDAQIRENREFEAANREAISRLSGTVKAQTKALAALQQQLDGVAKENARLGNLVTVLAVRPVAEVPGHSGGRKTARSPLAGMQLEGLQDGMAWISWQGRTWAVQPGDSLGSVTVRDINASERSVTTSAGVLR
ncbi:conjugal transfer protein TraP [Pantoea ananatis]|uniref:conjugal transfer protein TraP n=1 Tax=Pantoea ananas TaxID=553 RepID=UPI001B3150AA|nr:conjugal transfer protein TraP [Pantoea ananatis]